MATIPGTASRAQPGAEKRYPLDQITCRAPGGSSPRRDFSLWSCPDELSEIRAGRLRGQGGREHFTAARCPVKTPIMEPKAARLRRGEGPRAEQEDRCSGEGELPCGSAESSGDWRCGCTVERGLLLSWETREGSRCLCPSLPSREREVKRDSEMGPCPSSGTLSPPPPPPPHPTPALGEWSGFLSPR